MTETDGLLGYEAANAALAWVAVGLLAAVGGGSLLAGDPLWAGMAAAVAAVAAVPPALARDPRQMVDWEVLALAAGTVAALATGLVDESAAYVAVAAVALVVAVELDAFTTVEMTPDFAVVFVVVVTMAVAGVWTVAQYAADVLLGTAFLGDQTALMWQLLRATGVGIVAGIAFELYFRRLGPGRTLARERWGGTPPERADSSARDDDSDHGYLVWGLRVGLLALLGYGALAGDGTLIVNGVLALAVTFLPVAIERRTGHQLDSRIAVWIAAAATLHTAGFLGAYGAEEGVLSYYDHLTHAVSAAFIAGVGYALVDGLDHASGRIRFPEAFRVGFVLLTVTAVGVTWELLEFGTTLVTSMLGMTSVLIIYGVDDVVFDFVFNGLAAAVVALRGTRYFDDFTAIFFRRFRRSGGS